MVTSCPPSVKVLPPPYMDHEPPIVNARKSKAKSRVMRTAKMLLRGKRFDKVISKAAFDPPVPSYRLIPTKSRRDTNVRLIRHDNFDELLKAKGYRARGEMIKTTNYGEIPFVYLVPRNQSLSQCDDIILYSHGTSVDIGLSLNTGYRVLHSLLDPYASRTVGLVMWDYPGYGIATHGTPSEAGIREGILKVYSHLRNQYSVEGDRIIAMGQSMGSVATAYLASMWKTHPLSKVVLISPLASAYHVFSHDAPDVKDPVGFLSNVKVLEERGCPWPVLVFHGEADTFIPVDHGQAIIDVLRRDPNDEEVVKTASAVARKNLQNRIYSAHSSESATSSSPLWPSARTLSIEISDSLNPLYEVSPEILYKERSVLLTVPGAGHNDIMKCDAIYSALRTVISDCSLSSD